MLLLAAGPASPDPWRAMGYWPPGLTETAQALLLTGLLFAAPLYEHVVVDGAWSRWLRLEPLADVWLEWPSWRNYVAVRIAALHSIPVPLSVPPR